MVYWLWMLSKTCLNKSCEPKSVCSIRSWRSVFAVLNGIFYCPNLTGMESKIKFAHLNCMLKWSGEGDERKGEPTPFPAIRLAMETHLYIGWTPPLFSLLSHWIPSDLLQREAWLLCNGDVVDLIHRLTELRCFLYHSLIRKKTEDVYFSVIYQTFFIWVPNPSNPSDFLRLHAAEILKTCLSDRFPLLQHNWSLHQLLQTYGSYFTVP